ncbi:MAG: cell envelope integrity protein TolA [Faecalibacterium sp.]
MNQRYPVSFIKKGEYESSDFRFIDVSIDVMHTGANLNKTSFTKDAINKAVPTICNTPILGYVVDELDEEDKDFKGHEHELRITDKDVKYVYAGQAYGVIPESCNPRWIVKDDGTGIEREYLRVDGLIWTKFSDPVDIFTRDGTKNHSVELTDMACGPADKNGNVPVGSFKFDGCCILSTTDPSIKPAMTGSCVTANFSVEDITAQIRDRLYEYQAIQQNYTAQNDNPSDKEKGDTTPMNENEKNPAMTENAVAEGAVENPEIETPAAENTATKTESEAAPAENAAPEEGAENATTEVPAENTAPAEEDEPATSSEFTLTANQLRDEVYNALLKVQVPSRWDNECMIPKYWLTDIQGSEVIVTDSGTYQLMGIPYSMNGDNVVLEYENIKRKKVIYEDWDNGDVMPGLITMFSTLTDKLVELSDSFTKAANEVSEIKPKLEAYQQAEADAKAAEMEAKRNALFATFDEKLGADAEYIALKENKEISYSDLETKCYALVGRKSAEFSYVPNKNNKGTVRFGVGGTQNGSDVAYGGLIEHYLGNK